VDVGEPGTFGALALDAQLPARPYTLRQLLQHRAGLRDYGPLAAYHDAVARGDSPWDDATLMHEVQADDLLFEPERGSATPTSVTSSFVGESKKLPAGHLLRPSTRSFSHRLGFTHELSPRSPLPVCRASLMGTTQVGFSTACS
jgi:hypothetical protein